MTKRNLTIIGSYDTPAEAQPVIAQLTTEGYGKDEIVLFANKAVIDQFDLDTMPDVDVEKTTADKDPSLWEKIKDTFSFGDNIFGDDSDDPLFGYRSDIEQGKLVVGVYDYRPLNGISNQEAAVTIDPPVVGEVAYPDEVVAPMSRVDDSGIEAPLHDPNHLRNL